jgi:hypothetical protein
LGKRYKIRETTAAPAVSVPPREASNRSWWLAQAGFTLYFALLVSPLFIGGVEPRWDARDLGYPAFAYSADAFREGRFPLWDPYTNCGYPIHAEPGQPSSNPLGILLGLLIPDTALGFVAYWTLHWWWGGIGMFRISRLLGAIPLGGLVAAATYSFSGFFLGHAEHTSFITVAGWLPWVFFFAERAVRERSPGDALLAGTACGVSALGGYPAIVFFTGVALGLWLILRYLPPSEGGTSLGTRLSWIVATLLAVAFVTTAAWSPILNAFFTEGAGYTERIAPVSFEAANYGDSLTIPALSSVFFPYATIAGRQWLGTDIAMANAYAGILSIPLAAFWWISGGGNRRPWWFLGFFLLMFLLSMGGKAGVRIAAYYLLPPLRYFRFNSPFRLYWIFPLALAAGWGITRLAAVPSGRKAALKLFLGWAVVATVTAGFVFRFLDFHQVDAGAQFPRLFLPAILCLAGAILFTGMAARGEDGVLSRSLPILLSVLVLADMGAHAWTNQETVWIERDSIRQAERYHKRETVVPGEPGPRLPPFRFGFFNAQQVVKAPVAQGYVTMKSKGFDETLCKSGFVEILQSPLRFWLSPGAESSTDDASALAALSRSGIGKPLPVFVDPPVPGHSGERVIPGAFGRTRILSYAPERILMEVENPGPAGAVLTGTERITAGWKALLDGKPVTVLRTNLYFRGAIIPPGRHMLEWRYEPRGWKPLFILSYLSLALAAAGGILLRRRKAR